MIPIRIELPNQFQGGPVNVYLFSEPEPILVDTGVQADWDLLQAGLAAHGFTVGDLERVIITHAHVDHFGAASLIAAHSEAEIWVSDIARNWLIDPKGMWQTRLAFYRDIFIPQTAVSSQMVDVILTYMQRTADTCDPVPTERLVTFPSDGQLEFGSLSWQVFHTPGHASHQTVFYQRTNRWLLSADMLLQRTPTPVVECPPTGSQRIPGLPQFLDSLTLVEGLDVDMVFPGHGEPFRNHRDLIQQQRARIVKRKQECLEWVQQGCDTAVHLVEKMYGARPAAIQFAGLWMLIGYLDLLLAERAITVQEIDGVLHYKTINH